MKRIKVLMWLLTQSREPMLSAITAKCYGSYSQLTQPIYYGCMLWIVMQTDFRNYGHNANMNRALYISKCQGSNGRLAQLYIVVASCDANWDQKPWTEHTDEKNTSYNSVYVKLDNFLTFNLFMDKPMSACFGCKCYDICSPKWKLFFFLWRRWEFNQNYGCKL